MTASIELAGWTLLHFLWQGAIFWAVTAAALRATTTAQMRYAIACLGLAALLAAPLATAWTLSAPRETRAGGRWQPSGGDVVSPPVVSPGTIPPALIGLDAGASSLAAGGDPGSPPPSDRAATVLSVVVAAWLCGLAVMVARLAAGSWQVRRLRQALVAGPASRWQDATDALARRLGLRRLVLVVDSHRVDTPAVIGWLRPVIVLPIAAMASLAPSQVEAILAHELAHIRRHDFLVNMLQAVGETLLFYHPAVWWISSRIRAEREHCCDDVAVQVCGDAVTYAAALTELASSSLPRPALAMAAANGSLVARVRRLLRPAADDAPRTSSRAVIGALLVTLVIVAASVRAISIAQVGEPPPAPSDDRRFGPPEVNRLLGFELFPMGSQRPTEDPRETRAWDITIRYANGEVPLKGFTARSLIRHAYGRAGVPIVEAPRWLDEESFALATASDVPVEHGVADPDALNGLLRDMLEHQLGLVAHMEQREYPVYALVRASADGRLGPDIAPSTADCVDGPRGTAPLVDRLHALPVPRFCGIDNTMTGLRAMRVTMGEFVGQIQPRDPLSPDLPVVDRTGLAGEYDFRLRFGFLPIAAVGAGHPAFGAAIAPFGFRSMFTALPEQLGLALERSTAPFEVLVIDAIHRPPN